jgi:hypothetical protein
MALHQRYSSTNICSSYTTTEWKKETKSPLPSEGITTVLNVTFTIA